MKTDLYNKVTDQIIAALEQGVRPWMKPWSAEHAAGRITRPLRANGTPYQGINVLVLWGDAVSKGYSAPIWMTFRQALELDAHVRKGERGSTVVYASKITRTGTDGDTGDSELAAKFIDCAKRAMPADVAGSLRRAIEELPCGSAAVIAQLARAA
jgi:antirestriction protein ArdC